VVIESDDEARRAAESMLADVAVGDTTAADDFVSLYAEPRDAMRIMVHLLPRLSEALRRLREGDNSPETVRLAAFARDLNVAHGVAVIEAAAAKAERAAERRAATVVAVQPAPDIGARMTGIGVHGVPLPDDAEPKEEFVATRLAKPDGLMAWYIEHLKANGWTLDLDHSHPVTETGWVVLGPHCYFSRPDWPGRHLSVLIGLDGDDPHVTLMSITERDD
jgi:hypothetical protein